ncbi:transcriptional repressor [Endozoicomonas gorgoniicola]|uniref:Transcriptional repressor n=1 Tax=Endozoicomonas gorgoniicola TaxID=1234144 RepID=A0ABT3N103_9GAMM|nr:transcriptional repressor [Endozoicomonas gorgoniicola]MCW7555304.1 transcriptional repressor [Endozoicomonas gorgoniicola]
MSSVYHPHNHDECIEEALQTASDICQSNGVRLTPLRKTVLKLVWQSHQPVGAYEVLAQLAKLESRSAQPPTVYRALDFLLEQGLIHRLSSLNAFIGCPHPGESHHGSFLICKQCRTTQEVDHAAINNAIQSCASEQGFIVSESSIELTGLCRHCVTSADTPDTDMNGAS